MALQRSQLRRLVVVLAFAFASCASSLQRATIELRVLSYNIKHGHGNDGKVDIRRAARLIRETKADLVVLQEVDKGVRRSGRQDQMAILAELTGLHARFGAFMPYQGGHYGMGLLSRFPILESRNHVLPKGTEPRSALDARVSLPGGEELLLCGVHLYRTGQERLAQARTLVEIYRDVRVPMILGGDFNSRPGSKVMELIERHWTNTDKGKDRLTWPSTTPITEIDFILLRPSSRFAVVSIDVLDEPVVSDHRPVLMLARLLRHEAEHR